MSEKKPITSPISLSKPEPPITSPPLMPYKKPTPSPIKYAPYEDLLE